MGVFAFDDEYSSTIAPAKLFKALAKDADNIVPKVIEAIQSIEIVEGNGGPGTVKKLTIVEGGKTHYALHKVDGIDEDSLTYEYSVVGGSGLDESLEKVTFVSKVGAGPGGGSIGKVTVKCHTKGDAPPSEAVREEIRAKRFGVFKAIEGYVLANPDY